MSQIGSYVYCKDGKLYSELVYWDENKNWFICFDDDDPIELVMKKTCNIKPEEIFKNIGFDSAKVISKENHGRRLFDHKGYKSEEAKSYFISVKCNQFPSPRLWDEFEKVFDSNKIIGQGVIYGKKIR